MFGRIARAPGNLRGALWMAFAAFVFAGMNALIKSVGHDLHGFEIAFFRSLFGFVALVPMIAASGGWAIFRTRNLKMHGLRALFGGITMLCFFYAMTRLPLANATALSFSQPLFMLALAPVLLQERVGWHRALAAAVGFCGVAIAAGPGTAGFTVASFAAVAGAVSMAFAMVCVKKLSVTDRPLAILAYFSASTVFTTLPPTLTVWKTPDTTQLLWLALIGGLGSLGQYLYVRAYRVGEASVVAPFNFLQLPFAATWGFAAFAEAPGVATLAGGGLIVASVVYIMRREATVHRREVSVPPAAGS
jgi:drug/metabolite transporter (DMT)-like permease